MRVFPASAGVIRRSKSALFWIGRFPRIRGGDPFWFNRITEIAMFSPHPRG